MVVNIVCCIGALTFAPSFGDTAVDGAHAHIEEGH